MSGYISIKQKLLPSFWSLSTENFFNLWLHVHANSTRSWRPLPNHVCGCGKFRTDIIVHLRFKHIISCWFFNRCMHLKPESTEAHHTHLSNSSSINMKHSVTVIVDNKVTIISNVDYNANSVDKLDKKGERERERERERQNERNALFIYTYSSFANQSGHTTDIRSFHPPCPSCMIFQTSGFSSTFILSPAANTVSLGGLYAAPMENILII